MHRRGRYIATSLRDAQRVKQLDNLLPHTGNLYVRDG